MKIIAVKQPDVMWRIDANVYGADKSEIAYYKFELVHDDDLELVSEGPDDYCYTLPSDDFVKMRITVKTKEGITASEDVLIRPR
jgi:hypothetical protein